MVLICFCNHKLTFSEHFENKNYHKSKSKNFLKWCLHLPLFFDKFLVFFCIFCIFLFSYVFNLQILLFNGLSIAKCYFFPLQNAFILRCIYYFLMILLAKWMWRFEVAKPHPTLISSKLPHLYFYSLLLIALFVLSL